MSSPADILYTLLEDLDSFQTWTAFVSYMPDTPDKAICIYDTTGVKDGRLMLNGAVIEHPGIQIALRSLDYTEGQAKMAALASVLDGVRNNTVAMGSDEIYSLTNVSRTGTINYLGIEIVNDRRRHLFTVNAILTLSQS